MKKYKLTSGQFDMLSVEAIIRDAAEARLMVLGVGYYDNTRFDANAMVEAYREVLRRNDGLRVRIIQRMPFVWRQYIAEYAEPQMEYHTLEGGREAFVKLCKTMKPPMIPYRNADMCRAEIYSCSDGTGGIILWQHHACSDGYSICGLLYRQMCEFYTAYKNGEQPAPPKRLYSFEECLVMRRERYRERAWKDFCAYMKDALHYLRKFSIPVSAKAGRKEAVVREVLLTGDEFAAFTALCEQQKCSVVGLLMSVIALLTARYTGKRCFSVTSQSNGRTTFAERNTAGALLGEIPVLMEVCPEQTVMQHIKSVYGRYRLTASRLQFTSFLRCSTFEWLLCVCSGHLPGYSTWCTINYMHFGETKNLPLEFISTEGDKTEENIYVECYDVEGGMRIVFRHPTRIMSVERGEEVVSDFHRMLASICENPDATVASLIHK